jgi:hypothetical protein
MTESPKVRLVDSRVGIRNAFARMPFRFGVVTMRAAAQAVLEATVEMPDGRRGKGYAADFLSYKWFDKRPEKTPADNVADLLSALRTARGIYAEAAPDTPFGLWLALHPEIESRVTAAGFNRLGASFGSSMVERAVIDAVGRMLGQPFDRMVRDGILDIRPAAVFTELDDHSVPAALPARPLSAVGLRHTVGLVDPIAAGDVDPSDAPDDGFPVSLEAYIEKEGLRFLKVKVSGETDADLDRLSAIAEVMARAPQPVTITLDGNEQYRSLDGFADLMQRLRSIPSMQTFCDAVLFVEQPLSREVAMAESIDPHAAETIGRPLIIDEADGWTSAFHEAMDLGYRGVSHKNCKGVYRSLLNLALANARNRAAGETRFFLSAEDLTTLPVVSLQSDLAVVATLGIGHVERNGHHYFRGLDHLSAAERERALSRHPDLYRPHGNTAALRIDGGCLSLSSLQVPGLGVADPPDIDRLVPEDEWTFEMLTREDHQ